MAAVHNLRVWSRYASLDLGSLTTGRTGQWPVHVTACFTARHSTYPDPNTLFLKQEPMGSEVTASNSCKGRPSGMHLQVHISALCTAVNQGSKMTFRRVCQESIHSPQNARQGMAQTAGCRAWEMCQGRMPRTCCIWPIARNLSYRHIPKQRQQGSSVYQAPSPPLQQLALAHCASMPNFGTDCPSLFHLALKPNEKLP